MALAIFAGTYLGLGRPYPRAPLRHDGGRRLSPAFLGDPVRDWLLAAMASTLAGNLTVLGSVANLIVVEAARDARIEIGFVEYARVGLPLTGLTLAVGWLILGTFR